MMQLASAGVDVPQNFDVPAGPLSAVITTISREGGTPISYAAELTANMSGGPIRGKSTVRQALTTALSGTGLTAVFSPNGSVTIQKRAPGSAPAASGIATDISDIDVSGNGSPFQDNGFQAGDSGVSLRLGDTPAKEVPRTITTVTKDVLKAQGIINTSDAVQNVAGVNLAPGQVGQPNFTIRGFQNKDGVFVNGFHSAGAYGQVPIDDVERIEVVKGPTSILTGTTSEGGAVIAETKRPTDKTIHDFVARYGSYNYATLAMDFGGVVPNTEGVTYRLNASGNVAEKNYAGYAHPHETLISPALQWKDQKTSILVGLRYYDQRLLPSTYTFVPSMNPDPLAPILRIPRGSALVNPGIGLESKTIMLYSEQSRNLGSLGGVDFSANNSFQFLNSTAAGHLFLTNTKSKFPSTYQYQQLDSRSSFQSLNDHADITLKYDAGFAKQTSKLGFDVEIRRADVALTRNIPAPVNPYNASPIYPIFYVGANRDPGDSSHTIYNDLGYYYLEKFDTLNDRLHILGQVRYDTNISGQDATSINKSAGLSWTAGGAFDIFPWWTVYGNRTAGYSPSPGTTTVSLLPFPPEQRDNSEVGARFFLFDKNLTLTTAFFDLKRTNVSIPDTGGLTYTIIPGQESRGFEIEAQGQVLPGLNVIGSFSDVGVRYKSALLSFPLPGVPQYTASVFATYSLQSGPLQGVTFGIGVHGNTASLAATAISSTAPTYPMPGYVVEDALISYTHDNFSLDLKLNNLSNRYFFYPSYTSGTITVGQGRNFLLTGRYAFN